MPSRDSQLYSLAPWCQHCDQRAVLTKASAAHLAAASSGCLIAFRCPDLRGWHLRTPEAERGIAPAH